MAQTKQERNMLKSKYSKEHYEQLILTLPKGFKDMLKSQAKAEGKSVSKYVLDCVQEHESESQNQ